jgi:glycosyltransferase involved in cell wall biosynthesis
VAPERVRRLRAAWKVPEGAPIVLQAARLTGWKGQRVLIEAIGRLQATGRLGVAHVILAGDAQGRDAYSEELSRQVAMLGLRERVRMVGHVEDIAAAYLAAHVTVVASTEPEAFGRAATEAMAMGSPVIATNIGAPPETLMAEPAVPTGQITGWLVPPHAAGALAERIGAALALEAPARLAMGERARAHVASHFTVSAMQRQTLAVYDRRLQTGLARRFSEAAAARKP